MYKNFNKWILNGILYMGVLSGAAVSANERQTFNIIELSNKAKTLKRAENFDGAQYFNDVVAPIFRHEACSSCHAMDSASKVVERHNGLITANDVDLTVSTHFAPGENFTCGSGCHSEQLVEHDGFTVTDGEWMTPATIQGINWQEMTDLEICQKVQSHLPNADQFIHHMEHDGRVHWAAVSRLFPLGFGEGETVMDANGGGNLHDFMALVLPWAQNGNVQYKCPEPVLPEDRMNIVGVSIYSGGTYYYYKDGHREYKSGLPYEHDLEPAAEGEPTGGAAYSLQYAQDPSDIMATSRVNLGETRMYTWYNDGSYSVGTPTILGGLEHGTYEIEGGEYHYRFDQVVDIAQTGFGNLLLWLSDNKIATGGPSHFTVIDGLTYSLPPGQQTRQIVGINIDPNTYRTITVFRDGAVAEGTPTDLDFYGYTPGDVVDIAMSQGKTSIWYTTGYRKELYGHPALTLFNSIILPSSGYYRLPNNHSYSDIASIGMRHINGQLRDVQMWLKNGTRSQADKLGHFVAPFNTVTWPANYDGSHSKGMAMASNGDIYSWFATAGNDSLRAKGTLTQPDSAYGINNFGVPRGQTANDIVGIAIDSGGGNHVWTLYNDGSVSKGSTRNINAFTYWPSNFSLLQ